MTSCASVMNEKYVSVFLYTEKPSKVTYVQDTLHTVSQNDFNVVNLIVPRSKDTLELSVMTDSICKKVSIPSKKSIAYYMNVFYFGGFVIDYFNPKRYTYKNLLVFDDSLNIIKATTKHREDMAKWENSTFFKSYTSKNIFKKGDIYIGIYHFHLFISTIIV